MKGGIQNPLIHRMPELSLQLSGQHTSQSRTTGGDAEQQQAPAITN